MSESEDEAAGVAATMQRIDIVGERRRAHDAGIHGQVLAEATLPGARVQDVARRHGVCASLIYRRRREAANGVASGSAVRLLPVRVAEARATERRLRSRPHRQPPHRGRLDDRDRA